MLLTLGLGEARTVVGEQLGRRHDDAERRAELVRGTRGEAPLELVDLALLGALLPQQHVHLLEPYERVGKLARRAPKAREHVGGGTAEGEQEQHEQPEPAIFGAAYGGLVILCVVRLE